MNHDDGRPDLDYITDIEAQQDCEERELRLEDFDDE